MITLEEFTRKCEELYIGGTRISPLSDFRDNGEFDSLIGFAILVTIQENFDYKMPVEEFKSCNTMAELYNIATKK